MSTDTLYQGLKEAQEVLRNDVREDIALLREDMKGIRADLSTLNSFQAHLSRIEERTTRIVELSDSFKAYRDEMQPIRDDVIAARKFMNVISWVGGSGYAVLAALVLAWSPWKSDLKQVEEAMNIRLGGVQQQLESSIRKQEAEQQYTARQLGEIRGVVNRINDPDYTVHGNTGRYKNDN